MDDLEHLAREAESQDKAEGISGEYQPGPEDTAPPKADINTGEMLGGLLLITFNQVIAPRRGKHWELAGQEAQALGEAYGEVIDKYFPDFGGGCELTAVALTLAVVGPRMIQDKAEKAAQAEREKQAGNNGEKSESEESE